MATLSARSPSATALRREERMLRELSAAVGGHAAKRAAQSGARVISKVGSTFVGRPVIHQEIATCSYRARGWASSTPLRNADPVAATGMKNVRQRADAAPYSTMPNSTVLLAQHPAPSPVPRPRDGEAPPPHRQYMAREPTRIAPPPSSPFAPPRPGEPRVVLSFTRPSSGRFG